VVSDAEEVAEGECPPVPGEDSIAARSKDDVSSGLLCSTSMTSLVEKPGAWITL
jgi:hypothetical protein